MDNPIPLSRVGSDAAVSLSNPVEVEADGLHLFIDNQRVVELPEQGCITFRFKRGPLTIRESSRGRPGSANADLTLTEITNVEAEEAPEVKESKDVVDDIFQSILAEASAPKASESEEAGE